MALVVEYLDNLRLHKKRRRFADNAPAPIDTLPAEWREMLVQWVRLGGSSRWETLLKKAGLPQKNTAEILLEWLLNNGWAVVCEARKHGDWWPYHVELRTQTYLRQALGLPDVDAMASQWQQAHQQLQSAAEQQPHLVSVVQALEAMPVSRAMSRASLVMALLQWQAEARSGSYRDFALYARGDTKAISSTEWAWLNVQFDLETIGITTHKPLLYLSADLILHMQTGCLDLAQAQPFIALPPAVFSSVSAISPTSALRAWICVENLTSFERVASQRAKDTAVLWIPGFAPDWWLATVSLLLRLCPAPLKVACDPDPAGVRIARQAIQLWQAHQLEASAWRMGVAELQACKHRKPLGTHDQLQLQALLDTLPDLHPTLAELVQYMQKTQQKAEQESYL